MKTIIIITIIVLFSISTYSQNECNRKKFYPLHFNEAMLYPQCVESLHLKDRNLTKEQYLKFDNLKLIYLDNCNAKDFLDIAWELDSLSDIYIVNNLNCIPSSIGKCKNLKLLRLDDVEITELPKEIGELSNLQTIIFNYTKIKTLPYEITNLKNLHSIEIYNSPIVDSIPSFIDEINCGILLKNVDEPATYYRKE